jgi:hypothetical protein
MHTTRFIFNEKIVRMKKIGMLLVILIMVKLGFGQNDSTIKRNSLCAELGGTGIYYSLGYDRDIVAKKNWGLTIGAGLSGFKYREAVNLLFPIQVKAYYKLKRHKLEFGLGVTPLYYHYVSDSSGDNYYHESDGSNTYFFAVLGDKYALFNNRWYIGIAFTPVIMYDNTMYPWGALRVGYNF